MKIIRLSQIAFVIFCIGPAPKTQAVFPPPDGGYPGGNTAEGQNALLSLTTGGFNTAIGYLSLRSNTTGSFNTATGAGTLLANTADQNTATGVGALLSNTMGAKNTANGVLALFSNSIGNLNTANGCQALYSNTTGGTNTANGFQALSGNTTGGGNTATGIQALFSNATGTSNTAAGAFALANTTGDGNTGLGSNAGLSLTTGDGNVCIGAGVFGVAGESNTTRIRNLYASVANGRAVYVNSDNKIGTLACSRRFKEEIKPMDQASEVLFALKPVSFRYKKEFDAEGAPMFGLIAEDVEQVDPDLVSRNEKGEVQTVRYEQINAMLLNEFLKEHKKVEEQQAQIAALNSRVATQEAIIAQEKQEFRETIARQENEIHALSATLKEQAAQIQKVSAQIAMSRASVQVTAAESP
jgi:Chaperone of endosialidase